MHKHGKKHKRNCNSEITNKQIMMHLHNDAFTMNSAQTFLRHSENVPNFSRHLHSNKDVRVPRTENMLQINNKPNSVTGLVTLNYNQN